MNKKIIVFSLGGSLIFEKQNLNFNLNFLRNFKKFLLKFLKKDYFFVIVVGGGFLAKNFIKTAKFFNKNLISKDLDYLGIKVTELNALFLKTIFQDISYFKILNKPKNILKIKNLNRKILFIYGLEPGYSTDFVSVLWAKKLKIKKVINLTDVDYVYDKNPKKFKNITPITKMPLKNYLKEIANVQWQAKLSLPFDPVAAKLALKEKIKIVVVNGYNLKNLENVVLNKEFKGSELTV